MVEPRKQQLKTTVLILSVLSALTGLILLLGSCANDTIVLDPNLGGDTTRAETSRNSFGLPAPTLTNEQRRTFEVGDSFFTQNWVSAPASTSGRDGLGPTFNAQSCSSCHTLDGRGAPPDPDNNEVRLGLLLRLSVPGSNPITGIPLDVPRYGGQLQDRSLLGVPAEGTLRVHYQTVTGSYGDGTTYELRVPTYEIVEPAFGPLPDNILTSPRLAPQVIGMGLLQAIPTESILAAADPEDINGDGISGRPNMVWDERLKTTTLGRFGWKANIATVEQQSAAAFHGDIGITSALHRLENCPEAQTACVNAPNGGTPELTDSRLAAVDLYMRTLAVPAMRNHQDAQVIAGAQLFDVYGCASCHTTTQSTDASDIAALENQTIHPYTDLLLHDMGPGLADGRPDFLANGSEWRTPPLWGIGLIDDINGHRFLLHDGRARTFSEAILWHGGEAEPSKEMFRLASAQEREQILAFLEAL